jgi:ABC-type branched-subunit amino acid transport system substrate-binding protein
MRDEIARSRPEGGVAIRLVTVDSGGWAPLGATPLVAEIARARRLAEDSTVLAVIGPGGSREALQVGPIYRDAGIMQLVPTATSRLLESLGEGTIVLVPNDSVQGEFLGAFADTALKARKVALFYVPDEYGIGLAAGTAATLKARGVEIILRAPIQLTSNCFMPGEQAGYDAMGAQLAGRGTPDAVIIAARQVEAACLTRVVRRRWPAVHVLAGDGTTPDADFFTIAAEHAEGVHIVAFWHPSKSGEGSDAEFVSRFEAAVDRPIRHADAVFFDAVMLAASAIRTEGASRESVRRYLTSLGGARPPFEGLTGALAFTPGFRRPLLMTRVSGRVVVLVGGQ